MTNEKELLEQAKRTLRSYLKTHVETCTVEHLNKRAVQLDKGYQWVKGYSEGVEFGYRQALKLLGGGTS